MADDLEYAVDTATGNQLERLTPELLKELGYTVKTSGVIGTDGGWDAYVEMGSEEGIAHASTNQQWRQKLRKDAKKVADLEEQYDEQYNILIFVTNQRVTGTQEKNLECEIREKYGWNLTIYHRRDIIATVGTDSPHLAVRHLDVNPKSGPDHLEEIRRVVDERLEVIRKRDRIASNLQEGPVIVLHLIPNRISSHSYIDRIDSLPKPPLWNSTKGISAEVTGNGKYTTESFSENNNRIYTYLQKDGLFEAVSSEFFLEDESGKWIYNSNNSENALDLKLAVTTKAGLNRLKQMGVSGKVHMFVTFLHVRGYEITPDPIEHYDMNSPGRKFQRDQYQTSAIQIDVEVGKINTQKDRHIIEKDDDVFEAIEPAITEYWHELGWKDGSSHYDGNRNWNSLTVAID